MSCKCGLYWTQSLKKDSSRSFSSHFAHISVISGFCISMDEEIVLGDMIWSYIKQNSKKNNFFLCLILTAHSTVLSTALMLRITSIEKLML